MALEDLFISSYVIFIVIGMILVLQRHSFISKTMSIALGALCIGLSSLDIWYALVGQDLFSNKVAARLLHFTTPQSRIVSSSCILAGISIIMRAYGQKGKIYAIVEQFIACVIIAVAAFALARWVAPFGRILPPQYTLTSVFAENIGLLCIGVSLLCHIIDDYTVNKGILSYMPSMVWIGLFIISSFIGIGLYLGRVRSLESMLNLEEEQIRLGILRRVHQNQLFIDLVKKRLYEGASLDNVINYTQDAMVYMQQESRLRRMYILSEDLAVLAIIPVNTGLWSLGQKIPISEEMVSALRSDPTKPQISYDAINSLLFFMYPYENQSGGKGNILTVADAQPFFKTIFLPSVGNYKREIYIHNTLIAVTEKQGTEEIHRFGKDFSVDMEGLQVDVRVTPSSILVYEIANTDVIVFTSLLGILLGSLFAILLIFFNKYRDQLGKVQEIQEDIREYKNRLTLAIRGTRITTWVNDLQKDEILWDEEAASNFFGRDIHFTLPVRMHDFLAYVHPGDRTRLLQELQKSIETKEVVFSRFRVIHPNNIIRFFATKAHFVINDAGEPVKLAGVCWDVSHQVWHEQLLHVQNHVIKRAVEEPHEEVFLTDILATLGNTFDLKAAAFWRVDTWVMKCQVVWATSSAEQKDLYDFWKKENPLKGEGLAGRVWEQKKTLWIDNLSEKAVTEQDGILFSMNIKGVLAFPVKMGRNICGIMVLCKTTPFSKDSYEYFMDLIEFLGIEIGEYLQRKLTEHTSAQLVSIVNFSNEPIISYDTNGILQTWNRGAELCFRYQADEVLGSSVEILYTEKDKKQLKHHLEQIKLGIPIQHLETHYQRKGGESLPVLVTISPMQERAQVIGASCVIQDISELRASQEAVRKREEEFHIFVETTNDWIWSIDQSRKITFSNQKIAAILGYKVKEILGMDVLLLLKETNRREFEGWIKEHTVKKQGWANDFREWKHKDGSYRSLEGNAEPIYGGNGYEVIGFRGAMKDITERKRVEKVKNEFVSMVSHELRTPLTSIQGAVALLLKKSHLDEAKVHELLTIAEHNCDRLMTIINDILELQRMEVGQISVSLRPYSVHTFLQEVLSSNTPFAAKFGVTLDLQGLEQDLQVYTDPGRMHQVMTNLLSNAVKFSPKNSRVEILIEKRLTTIRFSICDQGPGISLERQDQLFQRFFRGEEVISSGIPGTGLGLAICKTLLEHLGGSIDFITEPHKGSVFYFEIPRWFAQIPLLLPKPTTAPQYYMLMHTNAAKFTEEIHQLLSYAHVKHSIQQFEPAYLESSLSVRRYLGVMIDMQAISFEDRISTLDKMYTQVGNASTSLILIGDKEELAALDVKGRWPEAYVLEKPIRQEVFQNLLHELKERSLEQKPTVLYVEEDQEMVVAIDSVLSEEFHVLSASDAQQAQEMLHTKRVHLILLSQRLTESVLSSQQDGLAQEEIPVIMLLKDESVVLLSHHVKATLYTSSMSAESLLEAIREHIQKDRHDRKAS